jgi:hypothetical protein
MPTTHRYNYEPAEIDPAAIELPPTQLLLIPLNTEPAEPSKP